MTSRRRRRRASVLTDPGPYEVLAHEGELDVELYARKKRYCFERSVPPAGVHVGGHAKAHLDLSFLAVRHEPELWPRLVADALGLIVATLELSAAHHRGSPPATMVLPHLGEVPVRVTSSLFERRARTWIGGLALSYLLDDTAARARLLAVELEGLSSSRTYDLELARALIAICAGDTGAALEHVRLAREAAGARLRAERDALLAAYVRHLVLPLVDVTDAMTDPSEHVAFNDRLAGAYRDHRAYWNQARALNRGDRPLMDMPEGWSSYSLAGLSVLARRRGISVSVRSGYAPAWMLGETAPGEP